jgi:hypothetical protein
MKRLLMIVSVVNMFLLAVVPLSAQGNPFVGTWKLNLAKSKFVNVPAPKSETRTVAAQGDGASVKYEGVAADGSRIAFGYTTNYDGKESKISGVGAPNGADTIVVTRVDANTTTAIAKKAGKVVLTPRVVVSPDGKFLTNTQDGINQQGQPTSSTTVWDKQ